MAVVYDTPIPLYRGSNPTITAAVTITNGGTGRVFYLRLGRLGSVAQLEKTMTESNSTATTVDLSVTLAEAETAALKGDLVDFQIISSDPVDVLTEGKFKMLPMLRA